MLYACILAGGSGTRLWPVSRKGSPKQVKPFIDDKTLLQKTYDRLLKKFPKEQIWIATNEAQKHFILDQIPNFPENQLSLEPEKRDTAAAIGLATLRIAHHDPEAFVMNINSDAFVADEAEYLRAIGCIEVFLEENTDYIAGIGIAPTYPETGYGYMRKGKVLHETATDKIYQVAQFTEKPDFVRAAEYVSSGDYLWNPTLFAWKSSYMLELFAEFLPNTMKQLEAIKECLQNKSESSKIKELYGACDKVSIDYAIFEKAKNMAVLPSQFGWSDVGSWATLYDLQKKDKNKNVIKGNVVALQTEGSLIYGSPERLVTTFGIKDTLIVDTPDCLLICDKKHSQDVKRIVENLEKEGLHEYL